jgi:EmrB/QacA subfamily drug resistance transporter
MYEKERPMTIPGADSTAPPRDPRRWWVLAVLCLSLFVVVLDNTVLNVAIPSLVRALQLSTGQVQWVVDAYSLVFAGLLLTAGSLSDRFGRRRALLAGLVLFGLGSGLASMAGSAGELIATRGLMGVGGALLMPGTLSILVTVFDADERAKAIGIWAGVSALGMACGPVVGGLLVTHYWWGAVFLVNVPVVAVAVVAVLTLVPESRSGRRARPDLVGAGLSTAGMVALVQAVISAPEHGWGSPRVCASLVAAAALLGSFVAWERRRPAPMLDLALFRNPRLVGTSAVGVLISFALAGAVFLLTQHLQLVLGLSPLGAGLRTAPFALAVVVTAPVSGAVASRVGAGRTVGLGLAAIAGGLATMGLVAELDSYPPLLAGIAAVGMGCGLAMAPASAALMSALPHDDAGVGSALNDTLQELGSALGVAVLGTMLAASYRAGIPATAPAAARRSLGAALDVSAAAGPSGAALARSARAAFDTAMRHGLLMGAAVVLLGAFLSVRAVGAPTRRGAVRARADAAA